MRIIPNHYLECYIVKDRNTARITAGARRASSHAPSSLGCKAYGLTPTRTQRPAWPVCAGAAPWDTCSLGDVGVELSPDGAFADHLAHHRGRRSRPPLRRGGCSSLFPARDTFTGEHGGDFRPHDSDRKRRVDRRLGRVERDRGARGNSSIPPSKSNPLPAELFENRVRLLPRGRDLFRVFPGRVVLRVRDRAQQ
jgi:hypothetical protein